MKTFLTRKCFSSNSGGSSISEQELYDLCAIGEDTQLSDQNVSQASSTPKPYAGFGSYRQLHGDFDLRNGRASHPKRGFSSEAPAKLGGDWRHGAAAVVKSSQKQILTKVEQKQTLISSEPTQPIDIAQAASRSKEISGRQRLRKQKSWSSETDREEAWERRKDRHSVDAFVKSAQFQSRSKIGRSVSDCCQRLGSSEQRLWRTRSLTDEDLDELRGCIDLGFGFSNQADDPKLWDTFPALELCYAISQKFKDQKNHSSPVSILDREALEASTTENKPVAGSWKISSPGDHPQVIKDRLRHWAQAVAFTVRQKL